MSKIAPSFREIKLCVKNKYDKLKGRCLAFGDREGGTADRTPIDFYPPFNSVNCMTTKKTDSDKLCKEHHVISHTFS